LQSMQTRIGKAVAHLLRAHLCTRSNVVLLQLAKDCVVITKAMIEAEPVNASKTALRRRVVSVLMATLDSKRSVRSS
jgi:hypothetical protein